MPPPQARQPFFKMTEKGSGTSFLDTSKEINISFTMLFLLTILDFLKKVCQQVIDGVTTRAGLYLNINIGENLIQIE